MPDATASPPLRRFAGPWFRVVLPGLLLALAAWVVYAPALAGGWIWDDALEIVRNPELRGPAWWDAWWHPAASDYLPLKTTLQWLEWHAWGDRPGPYHVTSLLIHIANALLVWRVLGQLGRRAAWLGGLLFAVHPLAVESVAWIAEQKNLFSLLFLLGALSAWLDHDVRGSRGAYATALALFLAALLCKGSVVMLPGVLLLHAWWRRGRIGARDLRAVAPFFALAAALGLVTWWFQQTRAIGTDGVPLGDPLLRVERAGFALLFYAEKALWPAGLLPAYPRWTLDLPALVRVLPLLVLAAFAGWAWWRRATWGRGVLFGVGAFALNLAPVLGLVPMAYHRVAWVADHFAYISLVAATGLAAAGWERLDRVRTGWQRNVLLPGTAAAALALVWTGREDAAHFRSEEALWTHTLEHNPAAWIGYNNRGQIRAQSGRLAGALEDFEAAVRLRPEQADPQFNLATVLVTLGRIPEALPHYAAALEARPEGADIHLALGHALFQAGRFREALHEFDESVRLVPRLAEAHAAAGRALRRLQRDPEALGRYQAGLQAEPDAAVLHFELANLLADLGRPAEAIPHYRAALRAQADYAEAHVNLGALLAEGGQLSEALVEFEAAVRLKPGDGTARENLATLRRQIAEQGTTGRRP